MYPKSQRDNDKGIPVFWGSADTRALPELHDVVVEGPSVLLVLVGLVNASFNESRSRTGFTHGRRTGSDGESAGLLDPFRYSSSNVLFITLLFGLYHTDRQSSAVHSFTRENEPARRIGSQRDVRQPHRGHPEPRREPSAPPPDPKPHRNTS